MDLISWLIFGLILLRLDRQHFDPLQYLVNLLLSVVTYCTVSILYSNGGINDILELSWLEAPEVAVSSVGNTYLQDTLGQVVAHCHDD